MEASKKVKVVILGGGVAGLSAAHHLLTKGKGKFEVVIFDRRELGGKARSEIHNNLPTEHGFRFFPGFYKHITETMKEIPLEGGGNVYKNNLVNTEYYTFIFSNRKGRLDVPIHIGGALKKLRFGKLIRQVKELKQQIKESNVEILPAGQDMFIAKMLEVYTSCNERIESTYDNISWTDFIDAKGTEKKYGRDYENLLATGISKNLVAVRADVANSRTGAKLVGHMIWHIINPSAPPADKLLNAPTKDAWLGPWVDFLEKKGLKIFNDRRVIALDFDPALKKITGVKHDDVEVYKTKSWNYYAEKGALDSLPVEEGAHFICAMPIEKTDIVLNLSEGTYAETGFKVKIKDVDPSLGNYKKLWKYTEWMNGVMFYFDTAIDITNGHITIADEDAAVTIISQLQYWKDYIQKKPLIYEDPVTKEKIKIKALLSVIVSNWDARSKYISRKGVRFKKLTRDEVVEEVKEILFRCEDVSGQTLERYRNNLKTSFLDNSITSYDKLKENPDYAPPDRDGLYNKEPLFINKIYTYHLRPEACTQFENFCVASDFLKTNADLGCMDSADEAARRAVNNLFEKHELKPSCAVNNYAMPSFYGLFSTARMIDYQRFQKGLPYSKKTIIHRIIKFFIGVATTAIKGKLSMLIKIPMVILAAVAFLITIIINFLLKPVFSIIYGRTV